VRSLSAREERFAEIEEVHAAGNLSTSEVGRWRGLTSPGARSAPGEVRARAEDSVERVIRRRGSARRFGAGPIPAPHLHAILATASDRIRPFVAVHAVYGLDAGTYAWEDGQLNSLRTGDVRLDAAYLCLGQRLGGEGAATVFLMAELEDMLGSLGDRGYRLAQLEGGLTLGRMNLAAEAFGHGATGLTFFDDDVTTYFSPRAADLSCMVVCAVGQRRGRLLPLA
jgi:hypothetical protein